MKKWFAGLDRCLRAACAVVALTCLVNPAWSISVELVPDQLTVELSDGDSLVITGALTNLSGAALQSSDIFLSISNYPFDELSVIPLLGDPDIRIPDRTVFSGLRLFELIAHPTMAGDQRFDLEFFASTAGGLFSTPQTINVVLRGASVVPVASSLALFALGMALLTASLQLRRIGPDRLPHRNSFS